MLENHQTRGVEALWVFVAAIVLHVIWIVLFEALSGVTGAKVNLDTVIYFLAGNYADANTFRDAVKSFTQYKMQIGAYFVSLCIFATYSGYSLHRLIRRRGWDLKYPFLRFNDSWDDLFSGEILYQDALADEGHRWVHAGTAISGVVDTADGAYLYVGILSAYFFDRSGNLDRMVLTSAFRRKLSQDRVNDDSAQVAEPVNPPQIIVESTESVPTIDKRYYEIDGNYLVLRYAELRTLNLKYLRVSADD